MAWSPQARAAALAARRAHAHGKTGRTYGSGKVGRKNARLATYGSRKHGISIAQRQRRQQRVRKYKNVARGAATVGAVGYTAYQSLSPANKAKVKAKSRDYARTAQTKYKYRTSGMHRQVKKAMRSR